MSHGNPFAMDITRGDVFVSLCKALSLVLAVYQLINGST